VTYQRRGGSWAAVSGYRDGRIFYRKIKSRVRRYALEFCRARISTRAQTLHGCDRHPHRAWHDVLSRRMRVMRSRDAAPFVLRVCRVTPSS
jgi:hypothetical protein